MKDVILLTKILFKSSLSGNYNNSKKGLGKKFLFVIIYIYLSILIGYVSYQIINSLILFEQEKIFINLSFIGITMFTIFQTIFTSLNILFFSKDIEILLPMPINPYKIIMAKFNCLILSQYLMYSILIVPILFVYGHILKLSFLYYLTGVFIILFLPIIPVVLTSLLVILIMKFTNIIRNKDIMQYVTVIMTMIFVVILQFIISKTNGEITNEELANKIIDINTQMESFSKFFINVTHSINALLNYNNIKCIKNLIILFIETGIVYLLATIFISKKYIKTVIKLSSLINKKNRKINNDKDIVENNIAFSYIKKEFKLLNRNPIFFMQCVLPSLIFPLIIFLPIFFSIKNGQTSEMIEFKEMISEYANTRHRYCIKY